MNNWQLMISAAVMLIWISRPLEARCSKQNFHACYGGNGKRADDSSLNSLLEMLSMVQQPQDRSKKNSSPDIDLPDNTVNDNDMNMDILDSNFAYDSQLSKPSSNDEGWLSLWRTIMAKKRRGQTRNRRRTFII